MAACSAGAYSDNNINSTSSSSAVKSTTTLLNMSTTDVAQKPWQQRLLGKHLTRCRSCGDNSNDNHDNNDSSAGGGGGGGDDDSGSNNKDKKFSSMELTQDCEVLGLYFSFVDPTASCDEFTRNLVELYESVNKENGEKENGDSGINKSKKTKRLEIIHVLLWSNVQDAVDLDESFRSHVAELPWLAVPSDDYERKTRLTRRYRIKAGVPTLILMEGSTGAVLTRGGVERTLADPQGQSFPWKPPHPKSHLEDGPLLSCGGRDSNEPMLHEELRHCYKGVYFSAHWCPPCKAFTPQLIETYQRIRERGHNFEVIFVSSDRSEESYKTYTDTMPWLRIPFAQEERRQKLARALDVQAIPTLVILDPRDNIITLEGRTEVLEDPEGLNFPWTHRLVNILTEKYATSLHDAPAIILFVEGEDCEIQFGESVLIPAAEMYRRDVRPDYDPNYDDPDDTLQFYIALDCETSDILREFVGLDDAVPLLTAIDIPRGVYAVMEDGAEITVDSVQQFVDGYRNDKLPTNKIAAVHKTVKPE